MKTLFSTFFLIFLSSVSVTKAQEVPIQIQNVCSEEGQKSLKESLDPRLRKAIEEWSAVEIYENLPVRIPEIWIIHQFDYNGRDKPETKEKQVWLGLGWKCYDAEVIIALGLFANDPNVIVEITRLSGAESHIFYKDMEVVKFPKFKKGSNKGYYSTTIPVLENQKNSPRRKSWLIRLPSKLLKKL